VVVLTATGRVRGVRPSWVVVIAAAANQNRGAQDLICRRQPLRTQNVLERLEARQSMQFVRKSTSTLNGRQSRRLIPISSVRQD
jgi:hypothetical protein